MGLFHQSLRESISSHHCHRLILHFSLPTGAGGTPNLVSSCCPLRQKRTVLHKFRTSVLHLLLCSGQLMITDPIHQLLIHLTSIIIPVSFRQRLDSPLYHRSPYSHLAHGRRLPRAIIHTWGCTPYHPTTTLPINQTPVTTLAHPDTIAHLANVSNLFVSTIVIPD
jgi:hypothetical protein